MFPGSRHSRRLFGTGLIALSLLAGQMAEAARLTSQGVRETARIEAVKPAWPVPNDRHQVFYLQRSSNSNTVVYALRFDAAGNLDSRNPVHVYWRRYNTDGAYKPLKFVEQKFAYGVNTRRGQQPGTFVVTLKPLPEIPIYLQQTAPFKVTVQTRIGGRVARPVYAFVQLDESGAIPRVTSLQLHGRDLKTGRAIAETFSVSGGAITK